MFNNVTYNIPRLHDTPVILLITADVNSIAFRKGRQFDNFDLGEIIMNLHTSHEESLVIKKCKVTVFVDDQRLLKCTVCAHSGGLFIWHEHAHKSTKAQNVTLLLVNCSYTPSRSMLRDSRETWTFE